VADVRADGNGMVLAATQEPATFPAWSVLVVVVACAAAALYLVYAIHRYGGRERALRRVAATEGLLFSDADPAGIGSLRFPTFAQARGVRVRNVLWARDATAKAFDYSLFDERQTSGDDRDVFDGLADEAFGFEGRARTETVRSYSAPRSGAIVRVDAFLPPCSVMPASWMTRTFEAVGLPDIDFESDEFNRGWDVRCADARFAQLFVDAQFIDLLLGIGDKVGVETFGNYVLFTTGYAKPARLVGLLRAAARLPQILSPLVVDEFPTVAAMEARSALEAWNARPDGRSGQY
jgi:hypothetical protein